MADIGGTLVTIFGGLISGGFGFFMIAFLLAFLAVPVLLISLKDGKSAPDASTKGDPRYEGV